MRRDCTFPAWQPPPPVLGSASADPTPAELSPPNLLVDPLLDSSSTEDVADAPSVEGIVMSVNESEDLPMHDDSGPTARVLTSDGSSPLPQSVTTEVL